MAGSVRQGVFVLVVILVGIRILYSQNNLTSRPITEATPQPRSPTSLDRLMDYQAGLEHIPGVTGTDLSVWQHTLTISTGMILPGEAAEVGESACQGIRQLSPSLHRHGWSVVVNGGMGAALYRCWI